MFIKFNIYLLFYFTFFVSQAQEISLYFPKFSGENYEFKIFQGKSTIVLTKDTVPTSGMVSLLLPKEYHDYKGMAQWAIVDSNKGGGVDFIINNENFKIVSVDSAPNYKTIFFENSIENNYNMNIYDIQSKIISKYSVINLARETYNDELSWFELFENEQNKQKYLFKTVFIENQKKLLYAARFREIVNLTRGIGSYLTNDELEKANDVNKFIVNQLNFNDLYTSGHWVGLIVNWIHLNLRVIKNTDDFIKDCITISNKISDANVFSDFIDTLFIELTRSGQDTLIENLKVKYSNSLDKLDESVRFRHFNIREGVSLPNIKYNSQIKNNDLVFLQEDKIINLHDNRTNKLLFFYSSSCSFCDDLKYQLIHNFQKIKGKNISIVSISADLDKDLFISDAKSFPWEYKFCDLKGMKGMNFINFGVQGTPTLYLVNKKGELMKSFYTYADFDAWQKNNKI